MRGADLFQLLLDLALVVALHRAQVLLLRRERGQLGLHVAQQTLDLRGANEIAYATSLMLLKTYAEIAYASKLLLILKCEI